MFLNKIYFFLYSFLFISISLIINLETSNDMESFFKIYEYLKLNNSSSGISNFLVEPGIIFILKSFSFISFEKIFIILSSITIFLKFIIFRKNYYKNLSIFFYFIFGLTFLHDGNQIKTAIALIFIFLSIYYNKKNYFVLNIIFFLFGIIFHKISIIILFLPFIKYFRIFFIFLIILLSLRYEIFNFIIYNFKLEELIIYNQSFNFDIVYFLNPLLIFFLLFIPISLGNLRNYNQTQKKSLYLIACNLIIYILNIGNPDLGYRFLEINLALLIPLIFSRKIKVNKINLAQYMLLSVIPYLYFLPIINEYFNKL